MDVTMAIGIGCLRHLHNCITATIVLIPKSLYIKYYYRQNQDCAARGGVKKLTFPVFVSRGGGWKIRACYTIEFLILLIHFLHGD